MESRALRGGYRAQGPRERLSDVLVDGSSGTATPYRPPVPPDLYPSRAEAIALLMNVAPPEVIDALRPLRLGLPQRQ